MDEVERKKRIRSERFQDHLSSNSTTTGTNIIDLSSSTSSTSLPSPKRIKGFSTKLERPYLRLTNEPQPSQVRPLNILKLALENVKQKYLENEDYAFACEQLKSIRQDLTVQNLHNRFTAHVYETHGRIALESGDLEEYNQCQSRLQEMKRRGIQISSDEFNCYRLLHSLYRGNKLEVISTLRELARHDSIDGELFQYALKLRKYLTQGNHDKFLKLYKSAPHMSGYILDYMLHNVRNTAYESTIKCYDKLTLQDLMGILHYSNEQENECLEFLKNKHVVIIIQDGNRVVDCIESRGGRVRQSL